jgi:hypothetical protein
MRVFGAEFAEVRSDLAASKVGGDEVGERVVPDRTVRPSCRTPRAKVSEEGRCIHDLIELCPHRRVGATANGQSELGCPFAGPLAGRVGR